MKDAYYFSHDSNARNDQRLMKVRMKYGMEGYGVYFGIIEIMRENSDYILYESDIESVSYDLRADKEIVQDILYNHCLFEIRRDADTEEAFFFSKSLKRRMEALDERRQKLSEAGRKGGLSKASIEIKPPLSSKVNKNKVNNNKINKSKEKEKEHAAEIPFSLSFDSFWKLYDYKQLKTDCEEIWAGKKKSKRGLLFDNEIRQAIMDHLPLYVDSTHKDGSYPPRKHPKTYLNNNGWEDEVVVAEVVEKGEYKLDTTGFPMAYCSVCCVSASYKPEELQGESKCCQGKLLANKPNKESTNGRDKNLVDQSKKYRRFMQSKNNGQKEPTKIGQIIGSTFEKYKQESQGEEESER